MQKIRQNTNNRYNVILFTIVNSGGRTEFRARENYTDSTFCTAIVKKKKMAKSCKILVVSPVYTTFRTLN